MDVPEPLFLNRSSVHRGSINIMNNINSYLIAVSPETKKLAECLIQCSVDEKVRPHDVSWAMFRSWLKNKFGLDIKQLADIKSHLTSIGGWSNFRDSQHPASYAPSATEKVELRGLSKISRNANNILATQDLFERRVEELMARVMAEHATYKPFGFSMKSSKEQVGRVVNLALSDLHFATNLDPREVGYRYGFREESRRLASIVLRTCEFKMDYRRESRLVVWLGGDLFKGIIHDPQSGLAMAEQFADAVWLLRQALLILAGKYPNVDVFCSTGNHDRNTARHQDRATSAKWDSYATQVYVSLKAALASVKNISVHIPRSPHIEYNPFPHQRVYATHGDTCINPGNPGKTVNIGHLEQQMATRNNAEVTAGKKPFGLFVVGHVHVGSLTHLASGTLITNGCLIPPDPYTISIGHAATKNGQYLWESTPERLVGDSRFLDVDEGTDGESHLDDLIVPWNGDF